MNPFTRFKLYVTGDALAQTDDVFEKARIDLTYNFTMFFMLLGLVFYGNLIVNEYWWQFYITTLGVVTLPLVLVVLKRTRNVRKAGHLFIFNQVLMSVLNVWLYQFELSVIGGFWLMVLLIFVFFVMGKRWGFAMGSFSLLLILLGVFKPFQYHIPPEQVPGQAPLFVLVPFAICVYGIYQVVSTRDAAEKQISEQKQQLQVINHEITVQKQEIISSINYAQRIQQAILPHEESISKCLPNSFILYKPKDIVSGDFFWFHELDTGSYIMVCADCTGHGVPGAFMTVICSSLLNQTVIDNKIEQPSEILLEVDRLLNIMLKQNSDRFHNVQDGMDLSLLKVNRQQSSFTLTSARRPAVLIRDGQMQEIKGSKFSLGGMRSGQKNFEEVQMTYQAGDVLYLFTDGYHDQFGGERGKKYSTKKLKRFLLEIHGAEMLSQKRMLDEEIETWRQGLEQVDDICVVGIRF